MINRCIVIVQIMSNGYLWHNQRGGEGSCSFLFTVFVRNENMEEISAGCFGVGSPSAWECACRRETWNILMRHCCPTRHPANYKCLKMSTEYYFSCMCGWLRLSWMGWLFSWSCCGCKSGVHRARIFQMFFPQMALGMTAQLSVWSLDLSFHVAFVVSQTCITAASSSYFIVYLFVFIGNLAI